jgi:hypothetical protein
MMMFGRGKSIIGTLRRKTQKHYHRVEMMHLRRKKQWKDRYWILMSKEKKSVY